MSGKVFIHPPKACQRGGTNLLLTYPRPVPNSNYYTVTFRSDVGGRAVSSKADAEKIDDRTLQLRLPAHERPDKVRVSVFGDSPLQLPTAEFEYIGVGAILLSHLPSPVLPQQVLSVMLMLPDNEIRNDSGTFDLELMTTISCQSEDISSLNISDMLETSGLAARDERANIFHLCGRYSLHNLANYLLANPQSFSEAPLNLNEHDSSGRLPADIAKDANDLELHQLFLSHAAPSGETPQVPRSPAASRQKGHGENFFGTLRNRIKPSAAQSPILDERPRSGSVAAESPTLRRLTLGRSSRNTESDGEKDDGTSSPGSKHGKMRGLVGLVLKKKEKQAASPTVVSPPWSPTESDPPSHDGKILVGDELYAKLRCVEAYGRVIKQYEPSAYAQSRIRLQIGDIIYITERNCNGNWSGLLNKKAYGSFPFIHVEEIGKEEAEQCVALMRNRGSLSLERQFRPPAARPGPQQHGSVDKRESIQSLPLPTEPTHNSAHVSPSGTRTDLARIQSPDSSASMQRSPSAEPGLHASGEEGDLEYEPVHRNDLGGEGGHIDLTSDEDSSDGNYDTINEDMRERVHMVHGMAAATTTRSPTSPAPTSPTGSATAQVASSHQQMLMAKLGQRMQQHQNARSGQRQGQDRVNPPASAAPAVEPPVQLPGAMQQAPQQQSGKRINYLQVDPSAAPAASSGSPAMPQHIAPRGPSQQYPLVIPLAQPPPLQPMEPVPPPPAEQPPAPESQWYKVIYQGDIKMDYNPQGGQDSRDYLRVKRGETVNILCEPDGEDWALVESRGKTGRVLVGCFARRPKTAPYVKNKPIYLPQRLSHIDGIVPGDNVGVCVDEMTEDLIVCDVEKEEEEEDDLPPPPMDDIAPPPPTQPLASPLRYGAGEEECDQAYEQMQSTQQSQYMCQIVSGGATPGVPSQNASQSASSPALVRDSHKPPHPVPSKSSSLSRNMAGFKPPSPAGAVTGSPQLSHAALAAKPHKEQPPPPAAAPKRRPAAPVGGVLMPAAPSQAPPSPGGGGIRNRIASLGGQVPMSPAGGPGSGHNSPATRPRPPATASKPVGGSPRPGGPPRSGPGARR